MLTYTLLLMIASNPFAFGVRQMTDKRGILLLISVFTTSFMIPALGILLMKPLGLIQSLKMENKQDRIGPFIICGVFYLWLFQNFRTGVVPPLFANFSLAVTIGLFLAFLVNLFARISLHAVGMGALALMVLMVAFSWPGHLLDLGFVQLSLTAVLVFIIIIAGLVGYSRLYLGVHKLPDIWQGYAIGAFSVLITGLFMPY